MKYLHTMIRVSDLDQSLDFYCRIMQMTEVRRTQSEQGRFTLVFLAADEDVEAAKEGKSPLLELTYNWDKEEYQSGRNFGHLAYLVDDIYQYCERLQSMGVTINRPPRDGHMAFIKSPDGISIEILQRGESLPAQEPWASMLNTGSW